MIETIKKWAIFALITAILTAMLLTTSMITVEMTQQPVKQIIQNGSALVIVMAVLGLVVALLHNHYKHNYSFVTVREDIHRKIVKWKRR